MIRLEQIQLLEEKIDNAVELINILRQENQALKNTIQKSQTRMNELESLLDQFKGEQNKIEEGIINALSKLDQLEDEITENRDGKEEKSGEDSHTGLDAEKVQDKNNQALPENQKSEPGGKSDSGEDDSQDKEIELDIF